MPSRIHWALLGVALFLNTAPAQEKSEKNDTAPRAGSNAVEVRFADDSTVKLNLLDSSITVATRYGKLTVPAAEIRRIELGLHISEEMAKRIDAAIARLASKDFKLRDTAVAELVELRELAYPALQAAAKNADLEVARRAKEAMKTIADSLPAEKLHLPRHDTIVAADFTIVGKIEGETLRARTPYFGEASLKLAEVRTMRWIGSERETKLAVDAAQYGKPQETWMETNIPVHSGVGLMITASGTVDLRPTEPGILVTGPDGQSLRSGRTDGRGFPGGGGGPGGGFQGGRPTRSSTGTAQYPGMLLGRVGEFGKVFIVGARHEAVATEEGKLYLRIVPSSSGAESSGTYDVRVTTGR